LRARRNPVKRQDARNCNCRTKNRFACRLCPQSGMDAATQYRRLARLYTNGTLARTIRAHWSTRTMRLTVNGRNHDVTAAPDTALLYVLRNDLELNGPKYGCGLGECGACTVLIDGVAARSCVILVDGCAGHDIVTVDG